MSIGLSETIIVIINLVLVIGIPAAVISMGVRLMRRVSVLETRMEKLQSTQNEK